MIGETKQKVQNPASFVIACKEKKRSFSTRWPYSSRGAVRFSGTDCSAVLFESQEKSATVLVAGLLGFSCMSLTTSAMLILSLSPSSAMLLSWEKSSLPSAMFLAILDRVTVQPMSVCH